MSTRALAPLLLLIAIVATMQAVNCEPPPRDAVLLTRFHQNKDSFEQLRQIMLARLGDQMHVCFVADDDPDAGPLMTKLGVKSACANRCFVTLTCTRSFRQGDKGYQYWLTEPRFAEVLDSLDGDLPGNNTLYYRQIEDGWVLFHQFAD